MDPSQLPLTHASDAAAGFGLRPASRGACSEAYESVLAGLGLGQVGGVPHEVLFDHLHATAFQSSPLGRSILGPADNIRTLTSEDLKQYVATHYTAPRMVVVGAGGVEHDAFVKLVEQV